MSTGDNLARRNSLSLRSPPLGSLADELINSESNNHHLTTVQSMLTDIKDMAERFSDFASCQSYSDETEDEKRDDFKVKVEKDKQET